MCDPVHLSEQTKICVLKSNSCILILFVSLYTEFNSPNEMNTMNPEKDWLAEI